jgi:hypothetical protein
MIRPRADSSIRADSSSSVDSSSIASSAGAGVRQPHGDKSAEVVKSQPAVAPETATSLSSFAQQQQNPQQPQSHDSIGKSPGEIAFFKLLHSEYKKASHFFDRAQEEFSIREERVREGMEIMKQPNSIMVNEKWSLLARSIFRLYKDLLLLETFAIMTYCSFSKILKKHDKVTGYDTRNAFMANIVNKANFTNYPQVMAMINRCEFLYAEVSEHLLREGKHGLYEDERLFINMIHRLNEQVLGTAESEGAERKEAPKRPVVQFSMPVEKESKATLQLRSLVEENDKKLEAAQVSEAHGCDDCDDSDNDYHEQAPKVAVKRSAAQGCDDCDDSDNDYHQDATEEAPKVAVKRSAKESPKKTAVKRHRNA